MLLMASVPAYFVIQPALLMRWSGGWRRAAMLPLVLTVPALLFSLYALFDGSNLWPLTLIFAAGISSLYLVVLWSVRWWM
ncbi:MAG: hypothetical protein BGP05_20350 [Rhizobiales bacterium 62-47]|nr:MAG: hypothetical protein BGP05_20350 [Rhizobiales bacterium 62-47]